MLLSEIIAVYCEHHTRAHQHTVCEEKGQAF
jgi:hypothetical protein